jgi:hypothetical protein
MPAYAVAHDEEPTVATVVAMDKRGPDSSNKDFVYSYDVHSSQAAGKDNFGFFCPQMEIFEINQLES